MNLSSHGDPARRRPAFWLLLFALVVLLSEGQSYLFELASRHLGSEPIRRRSGLLREQSQRIAIMLDSTRPVRDVVDSELGWRYRAGYSTTTDHLNSQDLRSRHDYDRLPKPGVLRIAAFGDSFVYGNEVSDDDAWCSLLEAGADDLEVLNYGVGGYGLDQAFLRFQREGMALSPDVVLVAFVPDDLRRMLSVYPRFFSSLEWPLSKPRFVLRPDQTLALIPNPLPHREDLVRLMEHPTDVRALGRLDDWYPTAVYENPLYDKSASLRVEEAVWRRLRRRYFDRNRLFRGGVINEHSSAFALQVALFRAFSEAARARGTIPIMLMLPDRSSVERIRRGAPPVYAPLEETLARQGLTVWDGADAFRPARVSTDSLFAPFLHYSPLGNRVLARWLARRLQALRATDGPSLWQSRERRHSGPQRLTAAN